MRFSIRKYIKPAALVLTCLLVLSLAASCTSALPEDVSFAEALGNIEPVTKTVNGINIMVDPRIELLAAVQYLSGYGDRTHLLTRHNFSYKDDMAGYFGRFRSHAGVRYFDTLSRSGFTSDAPPTTVLYLTSKYDETGDFGFDENLRKRAGRGDLDKFARYLLQFAVDTDFKRFYDEHREFYEEVADRTAAVMEDDDLTGDIEDYYGIRQNSYNIILAPMFHPGGFGPRLENEDGSFDIYSIQGPLDAEGDIPAFGTADSFRYLVYHEFSHSFVNPLTGRYLDEVNRYQKLYRPIAEIMKANAYTDWETCVNEHIVRAVTARLLLIHDSGDIYRKTLGQERTNGFYYINDLCDKLAEYETNRDKYGSFDEFYPELINVFRDLSERDLGDDYYRIEYTGPIDATFNMRLPVVLIYPTSEKDQDVQDRIREYVNGIKDFMKDRFTFDTEVISDEKALVSDLADKNIIAYGTVEGNLFLRRYADRFPFTVRDDCIIADKEYAGDSLRLLTGLPSPVNSKNAIIIYTAQKAEDIPGINAVFHGPTDYVVARGEEVLASGDYTGKEDGKWSFY